MSTELSLFGSNELSQLAQEIGEEKSDNHIEENGMVSSRNNALDKMKDGLMSDFENDIDEENSVMNKVFTKQEIFRDRKSVV